MEISRYPERAARWVRAYLAAEGYGIVPVNPMVEEMSGREAGAQGRAFAQDLRAFRIHKALPGEE